MPRIFDNIDQHLLPARKRTLAEEFRQQLMRGVPTSVDETGLRRLAQQPRDNKVVVELFLRHPLHAKLYLLFRDDYNNPVTGYVGSSNLTFNLLPSYFLILPSAFHCVYKTAPEWRQ